MTKIPLTLGSSYGAMVSWRWDRAHMRFEATHDDHVIRIHFHKIGGRWNKTLPDGTPNPSPGRSYWTSEVDSHHNSTTRHVDAESAKRAAVAEFKRRYGKVD